MTEHFDNRPSPKIVRVTEQLERRYGLNLPLSSPGYLKMVREHYMGKRQFILSQRGVSEALQSDDYNKAVLISEAISLILREISPERTRKRNPRKDRK